MCFPFQLLKKIYLLFVVLGLLLVFQACRQTKKTQASEPQTVPTTPLSQAELNQALMLFDTAYNAGFDCDIRTDVQVQRFQAVVKLLANKEIGSLQVNLAELHCKLGFAYFSSGNFQLAEEYLVKGLSETAQEDTERYKFRWWLGLLQLEKRDFATAIDNFQAAKSLMKNHAERTQQRQIFLDLANCYMELEQLDSCINYGTRALQIAASPCEKAYCYLTLAVCEQLRERYDLALSNFEKGYENGIVAGKLPYLFNFNFGKLYKDLANITEDAQKKSEYFVLARSKYRLELDSLRNSQPAVSGMINNNIGFSYKDDGKLDSAIISYQQALKIFLPAYNVTDPYQVPEMKDPNSYDDIIRTCSGMGKTFRLKYDKSGELKDLQAAVRYFSQVPSLMQQMRQTLGSEESKSLLTSLLYNVYEPALEATYLWYQKEAKEEVLQTAYNFVQAGKSLALLEEIQDKQALKGAGIPEELLRKDSVLQAEILQVQKLIDKNAKSELYQKKAALMEEQNLLRNTLETDYPTYYALKYPNNRVSVKDLAEKCKREKTALVDYFQGKKQLFSVYVSPEKQGIIRSQIAENELLIVVDTFLQAMHDANAQQYAQTAYKLYTACFAAVDSVLTATNCKAVVVIPDGMLHKVPFEAFITEKYEGKSFNEVKFLLSKRMMSYSHSSSLWLNPIQNDRGEGLLALAPGFNSTFYSHVAYPEAKRFAGLPTTLKTLKSLKEKYKMDLFTEGDAKKPIFLQQASRYRMLHFGTHAVANDEIPSQSFLVLAPEKEQDSLQNGFLFTNDIYATRLNARLAMLTACQTGKGKIKKGEGVMSLSRAFRFAGCNSIMMTLWQVNEAPTAELTTYLYEGIHQNKPLNQALHEAKLRYLEEAKPYQKNPFQWSALVLIGDTSPMFSNESGGSSWLWWVVGVGIVIALALGGWGLRRKMRQK